MRTLTYTILPTDDGHKLGRVVRHRLSLSSHQLGTVKRQNGLHLDGQAVHTNAIVHAGQTLTVILPTDPASVIVPDPTPIDVVYEDEDIAVINKPAPLACQSSSRQPDNTLENRMIHYFRDQPGYTFRPVNRLDKGTSGLMVVAKNAHAQWQLQTQLHTPTFVRDYLAIVEGIITPAEGVIHAPIAKAEGATVRREVNETEGKPSVTRYRVEAVDPVADRTLVRLRLETGRTHQIRVHMAWIGHPVFGDFLYGTEQPERLPGRFALHSAAVTFAHPLTRATLSFSAPLPPELQRLMP